MRSPYESWVARIEGVRRWVLLASFVLCVLGMGALTRLRLDIDILNMLPRGSPAFDDFRSFVGEFGQFDELVALVDGAAMADLENFAEQFAVHLRGLDSVSRVQVRVDLRQMQQGLLGRYLFNYLPVDGYDELAERLTPEGIDAQVRVDRAMLDAPFDLGMAASIADDPLGIRALVGRFLARAYGQATPGSSGGYFAAPDGGALLVFVRSRASAFDIEFSRRFMAQVRGAEEAARREITSEPLRVRYTGGPVYALEDAATMRGDVCRYTLLALLGVLAVFYAGYRSLRILPFVTYPLVVTTLFTFALSLLLFEQINAVSLCFAAVLYGLSIDSGIHFFTRLEQERERYERRAAVAATLAGLGRSNVAASLTTAIAFAIIAFSVLAGVRQLAVLVAIGMLFNTVLFFSLYPALALRSWGGPARSRGSMDTPRLGWLAAQAGRYRMTVAGAALLLGAVALPQALNVTTDVRLMQLRPRQSSAALVQDEIATRFGDDGRGGAVLVEHDDLESALVDAEMIADRLDRYQEEGLLRGVQSVGPLLPSVKRQRERLARYETLPRVRAVELLEQALARHGFEVPAFASFLERFRSAQQEVLRPDDAALECVAGLLDRYVRSRGGRHTIATFLDPAPGVSLARIRERLLANLPGVSFRLASRGLVEEELIRVMRRELVGFLGLALLGNLLLLRFSLSDWRLSLAVLAPVVLTVVLLLGGMGAAGITLDPVNLIVVPLLLGLGVDDGVYVVGRVRQGASPGEAVRHAGRALVVTSLTTIAGFGFLSLSRYPALATMGLLAGIGLLLSLATTMTVLPALLALRGNGRES